jgi:hypothetical protein
VKCCCRRGHKGISQTHLEHREQTNSYPQQDKASSWPHSAQRNQSSDQIRTAALLSYTARHRFECWPSKSKLYYDDSQSASPSWCQPPIWDPRPIGSLLSLINFRQLRVCWCGEPSLTRWRVCNLQCNDAISTSSYIATDGLSPSSSWCRTPTRF